MEYILLDPPCSGSGMTNRLHLFETDTEKDAKRLYQLAGLQFKLLKFALTNFPNAKRLIYSTCSLNPEENEEVRANSCSNCILFFCILCILVKLM